jgi:hypothetical protein
MTIRIHAKHDVLVAGTVHCTNLESITQNPTNAKQKPQRTSCRSVFSAPTPTFSAFVVQWEESKKIKDPTCCTTLEAELV